MSEQMTKVGAHLIDKYSIDNPAEVASVKSGIEFDIDELDDEIYSLEDQVSSLDEDNEDDEAVIEQMGHEINILTRDKEVFEWDLGQFDAVEEISVERFIERTAELHNGQLHSDEYMAIVLRDEFGVRTLEILKAVEETITRVANENDQLKYSLLVIYAARRALLDKPALDKEAQRIRKLIDENEAK